MSDTEFREAHRFASHLPRQRPYLVKLPGNMLVSQERRPAFFDDVLRFATVLHLAICRLNCRRHVARFNICRAEIPFEVFEFRAKRFVRLLLIFDRRQLRFDCTDRLPKVLQLTFVLSQSVNETAEVRYFSFKHARFRLSARYLAFEVVFYVNGVTVGLSITVKTENLVEMVFSFLRRELKFIDDLPL